MSSKKRNRNTYVTDVITPDKVNRTIRINSPSIPPAMEPLDPLLMVMLRTSPHPSDPVAYQKVLTANNFVSANLNRRLSSNGHAELYKVGELYDMSNRSMNLIGGYVLFKVTGKLNSAFQLLKTEIEQMGLQQCAEIIYSPMVSIPDCDGLVPLATLQLYPKQGQESEPWCAAIQLGLIQVLAITLNEGQLS